jgi:predicted acetyltransferase
MSTTDPTTSQWHLRVPSADELPAFALPARMAFGGSISDAELEDWLKLAEPERWIGAFESADSELVAGCASVFSMQLTVPGGEVAAAAVSGVGVRPDHRRRGILSALMRQQLDDVHERGEPLAALWASEGTIYQRFGYGMGALDGTFEVATRRTAFARDLPPEGRVRVLEEAQAAPVLAKAYEAMRAVTPGALSRSDAWWASVVSDPEYGRSGAGTKFCVVYEVDGEPEGYAVYRIKDRWDHTGPDSVLEVSEAVATTPRAIRGLWRYLFDTDLVRTVKVHHAAVPDPLQLLLAEPRALGLVASDGIWLRLVDLSAALRARRYGAADELVLEVSDTFCPWNAGRWRIETAGEPGAAVAEVNQTTKAADLTLDTTDLAAMYLGGVRPTELGRAGRIEERTPGALARANALFAAQRTPWCMTMF